MDTIRRYQANWQADKVRDPLSSMDLEILNKISIFSGHTKVFSCVLNYDKNSRIHLSSVDFLSTSSNRMQKYSFEYYKYNLVPKDYMTWEFDYWGYYNGIKCVLPLTDSSLQPNPAYSKCGMLTKLTFPTGGYLCIDYEQNSYCTYVDKNRQLCERLYESQMTGGLRVSRLACYEKEKLVLSKTYKYESNDGLSSGVLHALPILRCKWQAMIFPCNSGNSSLGEVETQRLVSMVPLSNSFGSHIGYSRVKEINADNTYAIKTFNNEAQVFADPFVFSVTGNNVWNPYNTHSERGYLCGKILSETKFDARGTKLAETSYEYTSDDLYNQSHYTLTTNISERKLPSATCHVGTIYKMYYPKISISKQTTKTLMGNAWITDVRTFTYSDREIDYVSSANKTFKSNVRLLEEELTQRGSNKLRNEYKYPYDDIGTNYYLSLQHYFPLTGVKTYYNGQLIKGRKTIFGKSQNHYLPMFDVAFKGSESVVDTIVKYKGYDNAYRLVDAIDEQGVRRMFYWRSHDKLEAIVDNGSDMLSLKKMARNADQMFASHAEVFGSEPVNVTACIYNNRGQIAEIASANRQTTSFRYDDAARLAEVYDGKGQKISQYAYNNVMSDPRTNEIYNDTKDWMRQLELGENYFPVLEDAATNVAKITSLRYMVNRKEVEITYRLPLNSPGASLKLYAEYPEYEGIVIARILPQGGGLHTCKVDVSSIIAEKDPTFDPAPFNVYKTLIVELFQFGVLKDSQKVTADDASLPYVE